MSCGVGFRHVLDLALLWLWRRPAAIAPIRPLAWEPPYAAGTALEKAKKIKKLIIIIIIPNEYRIRYKTFEEAYANKGP